MFTIVHTKSCTDFAENLSIRLSDAKTVLVDDILSDPQTIDDFDNLGLVFSNDGKSLSLEMQSFIRDVLGNCDLKSLEYMFSICITDGNVGHALKIVEKLCAKVGCAPSLSLAIDRQSITDEVYDNAVKLIDSGEIRLAKGSLGTSIYMLLHGIKTRS